MKKIFSIFASGLCFFCAESLIASEAVVRITTDKSPWRISKHLLGTHFVYSNEADDIYGDGRVADWMKSVNVGVARWPGGTSLKFLHWETPTGVLKGDNWDPKYELSQNWPSSEFMDLDEYLAFCRRSGVEPLVGVNLQSPWELKRVPDGVAEAVRCVEYCRAKSMPVKWWYLGNEEAIKWPDLANLVNQFANAMRKVDPDIKIIVNNHDADPSKALNVLLPIAGRNIDVYEFHFKWPGWKEQGTPNRWMQDMPLFGGGVARKIAEVRAKAAELGYPNLLVANNEWGLSTSMKGFDKYTTGLVATEYLLDLFASGYDMACYWTTQWPGKADMHLLDARNEYALNPVARGFELLSTALDQRMLQITSTRPEVRGFACRDEDGRVVQLFLINKSTEQAQVTFELDGAIKAENFDASGQAMKSPGTELSAFAVELSDYKFQAQIPPLSFCRLTFKQR